MPFSYATSLSEGAAEGPDDVRPLDSMTWQFYGGTLDPEKFTRENVIFGIAVDPTEDPHDARRTGGPVREPIRR